MDALHPTDHTLSSYGLGKLDDPSAEAVNQHLEGCPDCRKRVAEISSDSFLDRVRDAGKGTGPSRTGGMPHVKGKNASVVSPPDTLPPGLADHPDYEIKRELGRGGMGVVYLAHNKLMGRDEVLKVMGRQIMERPGVLDRFLREIRAVARLRHPNIVTAYAATRLGESIVFAMEYVEGLDLAKLVKARGPLPVGHACNFVYQAALGLQHAHEEGLVHRDIKPANLMLSRKGEKATVKVLDFGLAKVAREERVDGGLTSEGQALGTPDFIAPEQILDAPSADVRADIYSLGGTLYYLLTGRPPFQANSLYDMYQAHISREADPLNLVRPEVPAELAALAAKMMAKDPARRFQTPGEVAVALTPFFKKASAASNRPKPDVSQAGPSVASRPVTGAADRSTQPATDSGETAVRGKRPAETTVAESRWESLIDSGHEGHERDDTPATRPGRRPPWKSRPVALAAALSGLILLGVIVVTIRDREGRVTGKLVLPEGSSATVEESPKGVANDPGKVDTAPQDKPLPSADSGPAGEAQPTTAAALADEVKPVEPGKTPPPDPGDARRDRAIQARLRLAIPMKYPRGTPLEVVLNDIRKAIARPDGVGIPIYVNPIGLQEAEKTMTSPVTIDLEGVPLETTLRLALRSLGLDYCVKDGVLQVSDWDSIREVREGRPRTISDGSPESAAIMARLDATIPVRFPGETPLEDVLKSLKTATKGPRGEVIPIYVDPYGLQEAEKTMTSPVALDLEGVPLRTTLQFILDQIGMTYYVEKGVLKVTAAGDDCKPEWLVKLAERNKPAPAEFDALLSKFAPGLGLSARGIGLWEWSWPVLWEGREHFGRRNVLRTHPVSEDTPFVLSALVAVPAGKKTTLFLDVSHHPQGDWQLVVKADGETLHDSVVGPATSKDGWRAVSVDLSKFAGKRVTLELLNKANGWSDEYGFWGRIEVVSEAIVSGGLGKSSGAKDRSRSPVGLPRSSTANVLSGSWRVEGRGKELVQTDARTPAPTRVFFGDPSWTDYDVSLVLRRNQGDGAALLAFRSTDSDQQFVEFVVSGWGEGVPPCVVRSVADGKERRLGSAGEYNITRLRAYVVRVRVRGTRIECSLYDDEKEVARAVLDDALHPKGRVGLGTSGASYRFMDITVKSPDGKTLWKGLPDLPK